MPISDFHASTIVSVRASFGFARFEAHPDSITRALGIEPDGIALKGGKRTILDGSREWTELWNTWFLESSCDSKDVNDHLAQLLGRIKPAIGLIDSAWGEPSFSVVWKGNYLYAGSGPFYSPAVLQGIAALGAALYQDIYQVDQETTDAEHQSGMFRLPRDVIKVSS